MKKKEFVTQIMPLKNSIFRLAKRVLISIDEAEDITQEVLLKLWKKRKELESITNIEAYTMTVTRNLSLDRIKSKQASHLRLIHSNYKPPEEQDELNKEKENSSSWSKVKTIIDGLPVNQRMIIQMRDIEQLEYEEIAQITGKSEGALRVELSRARKAVKINFNKKYRYGTQ